MWHIPVALKTLALCLLCTGWTLVATSDLKGDPDLDSSYGQQGVVKHLRFPNDIGDNDLGPDPFEEVENYVQKLVKHIDENRQKGDPDELSESHFSKHNHYVNYPLALHPHHRQKRFLKGIVKGISKGIKGVTRFVGGIGKGLLNIGGMLFGRPQAVSAAGHYDQSMQFSLLQLCNEICVTEWTMWTPCSKPCGGGVQERTRENQLPGQCSSLKDFTCHKSTKQQRACNEQCPNGGLPNEAGCACQAGWSGTCCHTQNMCPYPGKPSNGKLSGTFPATYRAVAQFECNPGYSLNGDEVMHCQEDGTWQGTKPTCGTISCRAQPPNEHVRVLNPQASYLFGEEVVYRCEEGYVLDGPTARKCMSRDGSAAGRLSGFNPLCRAVKCEDPGSPVNGHRILNNLKYGGIANFTCNDGYKLVGPQSMRCLASGSWLGRLPTCEEIKCDPPFPPRNGDVQLRNARFGATVVFECDDGFELLGNTSLRCMSDGYWNGIEPKCKAIKCGNPGVPDHGSKDGSQYTYPHTVTFRCFNGYRLVGAEEIECQQDATWTSAIPTCEACPLNTYMDEIRNPGNCIPCGENMYTTSVGSTHKQNCLCNEGFNGPPGGPCVRIECPPMGAPVNGKISECSRNLESTCSFTCNPGYVLDRGTSTRTCQNNAQWDGSEAFCAPCPENTYKSDERSCLPCPDNSFTNDTVANVLEGCICKLGYTGNPGGPCTDVNECTKDGGTKGPCQQTCENRDGGYICGCSIPGYVISDDQHTCKIEKACQNLTRDDAPLNGGLVCHHYREENSQQCGVRCNDGYEFLSRVNDYEYCGPVTGYTWSFKREDPDALIPPCIEQFFPGVILLAETSYFVRACDELTEEEKRTVAEHFVSVLDENKICENRDTKSCSIDNVEIICGHRTLRRRKRGVEEELNSVGFKFSVIANKTEEKLLDKDNVCTMFKIPTDYCKDPDFVANVYRRFLTASVMYAGKKLEELYKDRAKLQRLRFEAAEREFEPEEDGVKTTDPEKRCPRGMEFIAEVCVPCFAGSYYDDNTATCKICPPGTYQMLRNQTFCDFCPNGTTSIINTNHTGATYCLECKDDRYGQFCEQICDCVHGKCHPVDGTCMCDPGWEGEKCDTDIQGCATGLCFEGVSCLDVPAPGTGYTCGPCPAGYSGNGAICVPTEQPLPANTAFTFNS